MGDDTETKPNLWAKWGAKATTVAAILGMIAAVFVFDDRYEKASGIDAKLTTMQTTIISEMRNEVTRNRTAMISNMQRDADDLEFEIMQFERENPGQQAPRYKIEKHKQILRDIEELKSGGTTN